MTDIAPIVTFLLVISFVSSDESKRFLAEGEQPDIDTRVSHLESLTSLQNTVITTLEQKLQTVTQLEAANKQQANDIAALRQTVQTLSQSNSNASGM